MMSCFVFLKEDFSDLANMGALAEGYLYADPNGCLYKMGILAETIVNYIFEIEKIKPSASDNTQANRTQTLLRLGFIPKEISSLLDVIRKSRNEAVHAGYDSIEQCETLLQITHTLSVWFMRVYGSDPNFEPEAFVLPEDMRGRADYRQLLMENERMLAELEELQATLSARAIRRTDAIERRKNAESATRNMRLSDREARYLIDEQLRKVGWEADTQNLRYSKGTRPEMGRSIAIAEWPTDLTVCKWGYADYALFVGLKLVGVVEANANRKAMASSFDNQCREYSMGIKDEHLGYVINAWGEYKVPFLFATNGKLYSGQSEAESGVWFRDARNAENAPKVLHGWIDPHSLLGMLKRDILAANQRLVRYSYNMLIDDDGLSLRPYQVEAVEKTEAAVLAGQQAVLLSMVPGTGKTRTILGIIHRFLKTKRFQKVLLLVENDAQCEEALRALQETRTEGQMSFGEIYDVGSFTSNDVDSNTKVHVATIKSLIEHIIYNDSESILSVAAYDLIIITEACREKDDYTHDYYPAIDYFDATIIAMTSTPTPETAEAFGEPVFSYTYHQAAVDGYLAGHEAPRESEVKPSESCGVASSTSPATRNKTVTCGMEEAERVASQLEKAAGLISSAAEWLSNIARDSDDGVAGRS